MQTRFALFAAVALSLGFAGGAQAQTYYGSDRILQHYDPFDTIPGTEIQGGLGSGLAPSPARPLVLDAYGTATYAPTNPLIPGPPYTDPRRYGQLRLSPYERRLYLAKNAEAYARRHPYADARPHWRGEATNRVIASTGYRESPAAAKRAYRAAIDGRGVARLEPDPDAIVFYQPR